MELLYKRTKTIQEDKVSGFCPGCMHSTDRKSTRLNSSHWW